MRSQQLAGADGRPERPLVMVVDDEEAMRDSCGQVLSRDGFDVVTAAGGESGLALMGRGLPEVLIVDLKMPGMSGMEFLQKAREIDPDMVAIVITGYATLDSAIGAMKQGAYDFLPKPFEREELSIIVKRALEKRELALSARSAERERDRMRDQFVALVSHQLKAPLTSLKACLDAAGFAYSAQIPEACQNFIERSSIRAGQLLRLLDDWLTLARVESGRINVDAARLDVADVLKQAIARSQETLQWHDVDVVERFGAPCPPVVGDGEALRELFVNLVDNAIRYTADGGEVCVERCERDGGVVVTVSDNGPGIPPEEMGLIFDPFYRGTKTKHVDGTGLGLAIAKRIAESHGGRISVKSQVGKGTTVEVYLPAGGQE